MTQSNKAGVARRYLRKLSQGSGITSRVESATAESLSSDRAEEAHSQAIGLIKRELGADMDATLREKYGVALPCGQGVYFLSINRRG